METATINFDPCGDVILVMRPTGNKVARFRVGSQTLRFVSPVFGVMLDPKSGFREGRAIQARAATGDHNPVMIHLEDDDPDAMAYILATMYYYPAQAPHNLLDMMFGLAVLLDKYDIIDRIKSALECKYIVRVDQQKNIDYFLKTAEADKGYAKWLYIAYVFQRPILFESLSKEIVLKLKLDGEANKLLIDGIPIGDCLPASIESAIKDTRDSTLSRITETLKSYLDRYMPRSSACCAKGNKACDGIIWGALTYYMHSKLGVCATVDPAATHQTDSIRKQSLSQIKKLLNELSISQFYTEQSSPGCCKNPTQKVSLFSSDMCRKCSKPFKMPENISHESSCSPVEQFKREVENIFNDMDGLDLHKFCRKNKPQRMSLEAALQETKHDSWRFVSYRKRNGKWA